jgi:hypothetical protein
MKSSLENSASQEKAVRELDGALEQRFLLKTFVFLRRCQPMD